MKYVYMLLLLPIFVFSQIDLKKELDNAVFYLNRAKLDFLGPQAHFRIIATIEGYAKRPVWQKEAKERLNIETDRVANAAFALAYSRIKSKEGARALAKAVKNDNPNVHSWAITAFANYGSLTIPELLKMLKSKSVRYQQRAARIIARIGPSARLLAPSLLQLLPSKNSELELEIFRALLQTGSDTNTLVEGLHRALYARSGYSHELKRVFSIIPSRGPKVLSFYANLLLENRFNRKKLIAALEKKLVSGENKSWVLSALAYIGTDIHLINALKDGNGAHKALIQKGSKAIAIVKKLLKSKDSNLQYLAISTLGEIKDIATLPILFKALQNKDTSKDALNAFVAMENKAVTFLFKKLETKEHHCHTKIAEILKAISLKTKNYNIIFALFKNIEKHYITAQIEIVKAVGELVKPSNDVIVALRPFLKSNSPKMRLAAASSLYKLKKIDVIATLVPLLLDSSIARKTALVLKSIDLGVAPHLMPLIESGDNWNASNLLRELKDVASVAPRLIAITKNKYISSASRINALEALAKIKTNKVINLLIDNLKKNQFVTQSLKSLKQIGKKAKIATLEVIRQYEHDKILVIETLVEIAPDSKKTYSLLLQALQDKKYYARLSAAIGLGEIKAKKAIPFLLKTLKDENFRVRLCAAAALGELGAYQKAADYIIESKELKGVNFNSAKRYLRRVNNKVLMQALQSQKNIHMWTKDALVETLSSRKDLTISAILIEKMQESISFQSSFDGLVQIGPKVMPYFFASIKKNWNNWSWRWRQLNRMVRVVKEIGPISIPHLLNAPKNINTIQKLFILNCLLELDTKVKPHPVLVELLVDSSPIVQDFAVYVWRKIATDSHIKTLVKLLEINKNNVHTNAAQILSHTTTKSKHIPILVAALKNPNPQVCLEMTKALANIGAKSALYLTKKKPKTLPELSTLIYILGELKSKSKHTISLLSKALKHKSWLIRFYAIEALGKIGAETPFVASLKSQDRIARLQAVQVCNKMKHISTKTRSLLLQVLEKENNKQLKFALLKTLVKHKEVNTFPYLETKFKNIDPHIRLWVVKNLNFIVEITHIPKVK